MPGVDGARGGCREPLGGTGSRGRHLAAPWRGHTGTTSQRSAVSGGSWGVFQGLRENDQRNPDEVAEVLGVTGTNPYYKTQYGRITYTSDYTYTVYAHSGPPSGTTWTQQPSQMVCTACPAVSVPANVRQTAGQTVPDPTDASEPPSCYDGVGICLKLDVH